ncbi:hypothetical protein A6779_18220 [Marinobacter adhaerens]|jgi:hypothetical protein|nr:hypothetical protein A6779_18220 [Marinobacter adhaerens]
MVNAFNSVWDSTMEQRKAKVVIPEHLSFSDLGLKRLNTGKIELDWNVVKQIYESSEGLPLEHLEEGPEDNVVGLILGWYMVIRENGSETDPVAEQLIAELMEKEPEGDSTDDESGRA